MKVISSTVHGVLDYVAGISWMMSPWLFGFSSSDPETGVPVITGALMILYSLLTDYKAGLFEIIPMRTHIKLDKAGAIILMASPWVFGFASYTWLPHVLMGLIQFIIASLTREPQPEVWARFHRILRRQNHHYKTTSA
jgi:hypothetical protein